MPEHLKYSARTLKIQCQNLNEIIRLINSVSLKRISACFSDLKRGTRLGKQGCRFCLQPVYNLGKNYKFVLEKCLSILASNSQSLVAFL